MICPKCAFEQPEGLECARCGIVFSRYRGAPATSTIPQAPGNPPAAVPTAAPETRQADSPAAPESPLGGRRSTAAFAAFEPAPVGYISAHEPPPVSPSPAAGGGQLYEPPPTATEVESSRHANSQTAPASAPSSAVGKLRGWFSAVLAPDSGVARGGVAGAGGQRRQRKKDPDRGA